MAVAKAAGMAGSQGCDALRRIQAPSDLTSFQRENWPWRYRHISSECIIQRRRIKLQRLKPHTCQQREAVVAEGAPDDYRSLYWPRHHLRSFRPVYHAGRSAGLTARRDFPPGSWMPVTDYLGILDMIPACDS